MIRLDDDKIIEVFYDSWKIPVGIFDKKKELVKLLFQGGQRQTKFYIEDSHYILDKEKKAAHPVMRYDYKGSCWCMIPLDEATLLYGPVQTGRNPSFPYARIPEHTWNGFREISRCLISLLAGMEIPLEEKEESYTAEHTSQAIYNSEWISGELNSFDEIYECVSQGDLHQLHILMESGAFSEYLDRIMFNMTDTKTIFQFNLAKTYHSAQTASISAQDLMPLVTLYLNEAAKYRSIAAYKAGTQRMLYDFTRYVSQIRDERHSSLINKAQLYIKENLYKQISLDEIAAHCMVSISTLQHRFKAETGISISDRIRAKKVEKACFLLKYTNIPCGDIAFRMGYGSQSFFIQQFKKVTGLTPAAYRDQR